MGVTGSPCVAVFFLSSYTYKGQLCAIVGLNSLLFNTSVVAKHVFVLYSIFALTSQFGNQVLPVST